MMDDKQNTPQAPASVMERNINALLDRKKGEIKKRTSFERIIDSITTFLSSKYSAYCHLLLYGIWIALDLGWLGIKSVDTNFIDIATFAAIEAIFLSTFVLIGQKRLNTQTEKWNELNLHISLLAEHEITKSLSLIKEMAAKMGIAQADDKEIQELAKTIHPDHVLDSIENASR